MTKTPREHSHNNCQGSCHQGQAQTSTEEDFTKNKTNQGHENSTKLIFKIEGMCCASEVKSLKDVLNPLIEGNDALLSFDLINSKLIIEGKYKKLPAKDDIIRAVARTGMEATLWTDHVKQGKNKTFWQRYGHGLMNVVSAICFVIGFIIEAAINGAGTAFGSDIGAEESRRPDDPAIATLVFYSISVVAGSWFICPKAFLAVRHLKPNTKLLTVLATAGAIGLNQWFEAAVSMYLFSAAELVEAWNMERARKSIRSLMELAPSTAHVVTEAGNIAEHAVEQIPVGAIISIKPGEKIPMDSVLISGFTSVNQAPITGESLPVQKESGDVLFAGSINGDIAIQCRVVKAASDSTLASIIRKVEEAQSKRATSDQWIENFSFYYVPFMIISSIIVAIVPPLAGGGTWYSWIYKGLELLVISCPCSLIISTPVSIVAAITAAARFGVLIKGGIHLENAAHLKAFAMDKTGTITTGEPVVASIIPLDGS
ncbi:MAG: HAD-IC family P-type ATPase, partial [Bacteroidia bacterium]